MSRSLLSRLVAALLLLRNSRRLVRRTGAASGPRMVRGCSAAGELVHECSAAGEHTAAGDLQPTQQRNRNDACLRCTSRYLHCALSLPSLQACNRTWLAACLLFLLACHGIPSVLPDASFRGSGQTRASCSNLCSSLAKYSGILHTEPLLRQIPRLPVHKFTAVPPALTGVAHRCGPAPTQIKGAKK